MTLARIYRRSVVYPLAIMLPAVVIFSSIINRDYKSGWLTKETAVQIDVLFAFGYWIVICILSLTIFFNHDEKVSSNAISSALSWFLVPGGFICVAVGKALHEYLTVGTYEIYYMIVFNFPFVIGLAWGFWKFRRSLVAGGNEKASLDDINQKDS